MRDLRSRVQQMVTRGKIAAAKLNPKRVLVQLTALKGETKANVEILSQYGFSFYPQGGEDIVLLQVGGSRAHLLALCADDPALRITDLAPGEFGFRDRDGKQIVFRSDRIEVTAPDGKDIVVNGGNDLTVKVTGDAKLTVKGDLTVKVEGDADITVDGDATLDADSLALCGGTKQVVLDGDPVVDGRVQASSSKVQAA